MKKLFALLILSIALVSCYKDYIKDFDKNAVYFAYQTDVRTLVVGEGMKIQLGVNLAGVMVNTIERNVGLNCTLPARGRSAGVSAIKAPVPGITRHYPNQSFSSVDGHETMRRAPATT